jgi:lipoteichoic acid synthase
MNKYKNIIKLLFFPILILYFETVLKVFIYDTVFNIGYVYMCLFSVPLGMLFYLLATGFNEKINKILFYSIVTFLTLFLYYI